jgi:transposase
MPNPIFIRDLTAEEWPPLEVVLRSKDAFVLRRCQILIASANSQTPTQIASHLACANQTVRNAIHAFNQRGLSCLTEGSSRPKSAEPVLTEYKRQHLQALLHQSPQAQG